MSSRLASQRVTEQVDVEVVHRLAAASAQISHGRPLAEALQEVADQVVSALGFGLAVVNFVLPNRDLEISAIAGPVDARASLQGKTVPRRVVDDLLERSERWGALRFIPRGVPAAGEEFEWVPPPSSVCTPAGLGSAEDSWDPEDVLLGPVYDTSGELIALLSVDLPPQGKRPSKVLCELLEIFLVQAGVAIENARLLHDLKSERDRLALNAASLRTFFGASAGAMATVSLGHSDLGQILTANEALGRLLGFAAEDLVGMSALSRLTDEDRSRDFEQLSKWAPGRELKIERRLLRSDGAAIWTRLTGAVIVFHPSSPATLLLHIDDISEQKRHEANLAELANIDPLTGLPNRRALTGYLQGVLASGPGQEGAPGVVIYADLDDFKSVNDSYGHAVGDEVLKSAAERLASQFRTCDVVARIGGDEFAVVAPDLDPVGAAKVIERVRGAFRQPLPGHPEGRGLSISLGAAPLPRAQAARSPEIAEATIHDADMAMYADKRAHQAQRDR